MADEPRLEEQALSEVAQMTISTQLDEVENIDVDIRTNLLSMVQGQVDSVSIVGQGLVMQKDIRVQEMELRTDSIAINPLSAIFGQIELNQPVGATARLVLTEQDINRAINSDYIRSKFSTVDLTVEGQIVTVESQHLEVCLSASGTMAVSGTVWLHEMGNTRPLGFTAAIAPRTLSQPFLLKAFNCTNGEGVSLELAIAFLKKAGELLNLPFIELDGMALRIKELEVQEGSLTVLSEAYVRQLPDFNSEG
jgi:hypothetical protein